MTFDFHHGFCKKLEEKRMWLVAAVLFLYFAVTIALAWQKLPWNDELFSLHFAQLSSLKEIWTALKSGADQIPLFFVLLTRASLKLFGANMIALRLPEIIGYAVMNVSLFFFVSRRTTVFTGLLAMIFPLFTRAHEYAYEARPYGLVLGFSAFSLLCWQRADFERRKIALIGLFVGLTAAVASHYYAVLVLLPLMGAELARSVSKRRMDPMIWLIFLLSLSPLLVAFPLIQSVSGYAGHFWAKASWLSAGTTFSFLLQPAVLPMTGLLLLLSALLLPGYGSNTQYRSSAIPFAEVVAAFGFFLLPFAGVILGKMVTGVFAERYALSAVIGISIILAFLYHRLLGSRIAITLCLLFFLVFCFFLKGSAEYIRQTRNTSTWNQICAFLEKKSEEGLPLVSWHSNGAVELSYYCSSVVAAKIIYLADPPSALNYLGHSTIDRGLLELRPWFPVRVEPYEEFARIHREFFVFGFTQYPEWNWLLSRLLEDQLQVTLVSRHRHDFVLYRVTSDGNGFD